MRESTTEKTCMAISLASGATPLNCGDLPAAIPATWVPWPQSPVQGWPAPTPSILAWPLGQLLAREKQASATTLSRKKGWLLSTPVSNMATV